MVLLEMAFTGTGGLEDLVGQVADAVEAVLEAHGEDWSEAYPITLRETLRLSLQQQIVTGRRPAVAPGSHHYSVWMALPNGGLRGWTDGLTQRVLDGCGAASRGESLRRELQAALVDRLGPCLRQADPAEALSRN